jgi:hypothetical protein
MKKIFIILSIIFLGCNNNKVEKSNGKIIEAPIKSEKIQVLNIGFFTFGIPAMLPKSILMKMI